MKKLLLMAMLAVSLATFSLFASDSDSDRSMTASGSITARNLVKVAGANTVAQASTGDEVIGRALQTTSSGALLDVKLFRPVVQLTASGAITAGASVYADTLGKVTATASGRRIGIALNATTNSGDLCDVLIAPRPNGIISAQSSAAGSANTDTSEDVLFTYPLPANTLTSPNQVLKIKAWGHCASNTNNKTIKLYFGSEVITSGTLTDNNKNWEAELTVIRTGTSTQQVLGKLLHDTANITPYSAAGAETETAAITIKVTGQSGTAANDILCYAMTVESGN